MQQLVLKNIWQGVLGKCSRQCATKRKSLLHKETYVIQIYPHHIIKMGILNHTFYNINIQTAIIQ